MIKAALIGWAVVAGMPPQDDTQEFDYQVIEAYEHKAECEIAAEAAGDVFILLNIEKPPIYCKPMYQGKDGEPPIVDVTPDKEIDLSY